MTIKEVKKCMWLFEVLLEDGPRTTSDLCRTTQMSRRLVEDCIYELVQQGRVFIRPDSKLCLRRT